MAVKARRLGNAILTEAMNRVETTSKIVSILMLFIWVILQRFEHLLRLNPFLFFHKHFSAKVGDQAGIVKRI